MSLPSLDDQNLPYLDTIYPVVVHFVIAMVFLRRILQRMFDESEFLGPYGIRSPSKFHANHPYVLQIHGNEHQVDYGLAESTTGLFGGNSSWRGPVWFPINFLIIESLQKYHHYLG